MPRARKTIPGERLDALHGVVRNMLDILIKAGEDRKKSVQQLGALLIDLDRRVVALGGRSPRRGSRASQPSGSVGPRPRAGSPFLPEPACT